MFFLISWPYPYLTYRYFITPLGYKCDVVVGNHACLRAGFVPSVIPHPWSVDWLGHRLSLVVEKLQFDSQRLATYTSLARLQKTGEQEQCVVSLGACHHAVQSDYCYLPLSAEYSAVSTTKLILVTLVLKIWVGFMYIITFCSCVRGVVAADLLYTCIAS